jgi:hypothetical protein
MGYLMLPVSSMHFDASTILMAEARILNLGVFKKNLEVSHAQVSANGVVKFLASLKHFLSRV